MVKKRILNKVGIGLAAFCIPNLSSFSVIAGIVFDLQKDFLVLRLTVPRWSMNSSKPVMSCGRIWKLQPRLFSTRLGRSGPMVL